MKKWRKSKWEHNWSSGSRQVGGEKIYNVDFDFKDEKKKMKSLHCKQNCQYSLDSILKESKHIPVPNIMK